MNLDKKKKRISLVGKQGSGLDEEKNKRGKLFLRSRNWDADAVVTTGSVGRSWRENRTTMGQRVDRNKLSTDTYEFARRVPKGGKIYELATYRRLKNE